MGAASRIKLENSKSYRPRYIHMLPGLFSSFILLLLLKYFLVTPPRGRYATPQNNNQIITSIANGLCAKYVYVKSRRTMYDKLFILINREPMDNANDCFPI